MHDVERLSSWQTRLAGSDSAEAWREFLLEHGPAMLQIAREIERDPDDAADAWLFACERLSADGFRRLRQFDPSGPARFTTWLRTVTANLVLDCRRKRVGRHRPLAVIERSSMFEQRVFACRAEGLSVAETTARLKAEFPEVTPAQVADAEDAIASRLSPHERWLLATRRASTLRLADLLGDDGQGQVALRDPRPDPERALLAAEQDRRVELAVAGLPPQDRLLIELRFARGLTLARVAAICQLKDQWAADRRIRDVLQRLRKMLDATR